MECKVIKTINGWSPANEDTTKYHRRFNVGDLYYFNIKHYQDQRNQKLLEKYWVVLQKVVDNVDRYRVKEDLHEDIKFALDLCEHRQDIRTGNMYKVPRSIAMHKMGQAEFERYYSDAINVILQFVLPKTSREELVDEIVSFG